MSDEKDRTASNTGVETPRAKRSLARRLVRWAIRGAAAFGLLIVVLLAAGFLWERAASAGFEDKYPAPGKKVTLSDGRALHFVVKGEGEPTLVFESGAGGPHTDWARVIDELAETTRVIAYDRAGYGWSDPSSETNSALIIADLHEGLAGLGVTEPIVLVGHSIGGVYVRHYASVYPDDVAGLVFVDSSHEEQMERIPPAVAEMMNSQLSMIRAVAVGSRFGMLRALSAVGANPMTHEDMAEVQQAMKNRSSTIRAVVREMSSIEESSRQAKLAARPFGDLPFLVLSATKAPEGVPPEMAEHLDAMQATWRELQAELAGLSSNSRHVPVPDAGHYVQFDRPDVVIDEIGVMIQGFRTD